jgi:hypothetical protein
VTESIVEARPFVRTACATFGRGTRLLGGFFTVSVVYRNSE